MIPSLFPELGNWLSIPDGDPRGYEIFKRHYSFNEYSDNRRKVYNKPHFVGPGERMILITPDSSALFIWRKYIDNLGYSDGINCSVFRNESPILSSQLILEAEELALSKWGRDRLFTFVNPRKIRSTNPGFCFLMAGWNRIGITKKRKLIILEKYPEERKGRNVR